MFFAVSNFINTNQRPETEGGIEHWGIALRKGIIEMRKSLQSELCLL